MQKSIPQLLIGLRFLIAPLLLVDAMDNHITPWFLVGFCVAFLSDIFDGIIARRLEVSNTQLRKADSWADICLYCCIAWSAVHLYANCLVPFQIPLLTFFGAQLVLFTLNLIKYGKLPCYHSYSAKMWGIMLFMATIALFGFGQTGIFLWLAIAFGWINTLEEILITLVLPLWTYDVPSLFHALQKSQASNPRLLNLKSPI